MHREPAAGPATIEDGSIFLTNPELGWVEALAASNGATLWTQDEAGGYWAWSDGSEVFALSDAGELSALDRDSGAVLWVQPAFQPYWLALGDRFVVGWSNFGGGDSSSVAAASAGDGHLLWSENLNGSVDVEILGEVVILTQTRANGREWLVALDAATGRRLWTRKCECATRACDCSVAGAAGDTVFVGLGDHLAAVDLATGVEAWSVALQGEVGQVLVAEGRVFVGTTTFEGTGKTSGTTTALGLSDGSVLWQQSLSIGVPYRPVLAGSLLLVVAHNPTPAEH